MPDKITAMNCPSCGAPVSRSDKACGFCGREIIVTNFSSVSLIPPAELQKYASAYKALAERDPLDSDIKISLGFCYLKLKVYDLAIASFESAIEQHISNPDVYFYTAVSLLRGKKAFLAPRLIIDKVESCVNAAIDLEERPVFYYFLAYIKYDYYSRKSYRTSPTYQQALGKALEIGLNASEVDELHGLLGVQQPPQLKPETESAPADVQTLPPPLAQSVSATSRNVSAADTDPSRKQNRKADIALVMGVISVLGGAVLLLPPVLAVVFGHGAVAQCKKNPSVGKKGIAIAGLVMGWICIAVMLLVIVSAALGPSH